jgi:hypothetical protein
MLGVFEAAGIWSAGEQRSVCKSLKQTRVDSEKNCRLKGKNQTKTFEKMWGASGYHGGSVLGHKIRAWAATIIGNSKACMPKSQCWHVVLKCRFEYTEWLYMPNTIHKFIHSQKSLKLPKNTQKYTSF